MRLVNHSRHQLRTAEARWTSSITLYWVLKLRKKTAVFKLSDIMHRIKCANGISNVFESLCYLRSFMCLFSSFDLMTQIDFHFSNTHEIGWWCLFFSLVGFCISFAHTRYTIRQRFCHNIFRLEWAYIFLARVNLIERFKLIESRENA